jgi:mercuric ion binding protein
LLAVAVLASAAIFGGAAAGERTTTLVVEGMTCASCPYIVRKSLERLPGVTKAVVSLEDGLARVTYDDAMVTVAALTAATADAGFPSRPLEAEGR